VAKYYIPKGFKCSDGSTAMETGWIPVCDECASLVKRYNPQFGLEYYDKKFEAEYGPYNHKWEQQKINLVSNLDGTDTYQCIKCRKKVDVLIWNRKDYGCTVPDQGPEEEER
jgi:hypothetical protein